LARPAPARSAALPSPNPCMRKIWLLDPSPYQPEATAGRRGGTDPVCCKPAQSVVEPSNESGRREGGRGVLLRGPLCGKLFL
jgi:hypothetical protein